MLVVDRSVVCQVVSPQECSGAPCGYQDRVQYHLRNVVVPLAGTRIVYNITSLRWLGGSRILKFRVGMSLGNLCHRFCIVSMCLYMLKMLGVQTPHNVAINVVAAAQRVTAFLPFDLKVAMLVEADSPLVVS